MTEDHRLRPVPVALDDMEVGPADPHRCDPDQHLARARLAQLDLAYLQRSARAVEDGRACLQPQSSATSSSTVRNSAILTSAYEVAACCHSSLIVAVASAASTTSKPWSAPSRQVCSIAKFVHAPQT